MIVSLPILGLVAALHTPLPLALGQAAETPQIIRGPRRARPEPKPAPEPQEACRSCAVEAERTRELDAREARLRAREQELSAREKSQEDAARKQGEAETARKKQEEAEAAKRRKALEKHSRELQQEFKNAADALGGF